CHGVNDKDQAGSAPPVNRPEALRELLKHLKSKQSIPTKSVNQP
ncbi:MAG: hypothetical protein RJA10_1798, partial [Pseudomonadota bacterium]